MRKHAVRMMRVVFELEGKTHSMTVTSRDWCRDPKGRVWVRYRDCCCRVSRAQPYISDWIDELFKERDEDDFDK